VINKIIFDLVKSQFKLRKINKIEKPIIGKIILPLLNKTFSSPAQVAAATKVVKPTIID